MIPILRPLERKRSTTASLLVCLGLCLALTTGCIEGRSSTHELEHEVPAHWPSGVTDAADKIDERLAKIGSQGAEARQAQAELIEIVSWLPEVTADTAMRESDWDSIHAACMEIGTRLQATNDVQSCKEKIANLSARLRTLEATADAVSP